MKSKLGKRAETRPHPASIRARRALPGPVPGWAGFNSHQREFLAKLPTETFPIHVVRKLGMKDRWYISPAQQTTEFLAAKIFAYTHPGVVLALYMEDMYRDAVFSAGKMAKSTDEKTLVQGIRLIKELRAVGQSKVLQDAKDGAVLDEPSGGLSTHIGWQENPLPDQQEGFEYTILFRVGNKAISGAGGSQGSYRFFLMERKGYFIAEMERTCKTMNIEVLPNRAEVQADPDNVKGNMSYFVSVTLTSPTSPGGVINPSHDLLDYVTPARKDTWETPVEWLNGS